MYRRKLRKLRCSCLLTLPVSVLYFLSDPVAVQRQPVQPGGTVHGAAALDSAASHPSELPGYFLPQPGGLIGAAHLCRVAAEFLQDRLSRDHHLPS